MIASYRYLRCLLSITIVQEVNKTPKPVSRNIIQESLECDI